MILSTILLNSTIKVTYLTLPLFCRAATTAVSVRRATLAPTRAAVTWTTSVCPADTTVLQRPTAYTWDQHSLDVW